jgi:predicted DNA-binding ribbon-helix-helix protein
VALEKEFWAELERLASMRGLSLPRLFAQLLEKAEGRSLASAARVFALLNPTPQQGVMMR